MCKLLFRFGADSVLYTLFLLHFSNLILFHCLISFTLQMFNNKKGQKTLHIFHPSYTYIINYILS